MNTLVKKEIRLLLPSFGVALVLALSVWLIPTESAPERNFWTWLIVLPLIFCPALVVMASLDSFGRELNSNTFASLLAQPVARSRVWWTKITLLAAALLIVFGVWWLSFILHLPKFFWANSKDMNDTFIGTGLLLVTAYSGGLWTVLLLRQVGAAFWFTLIVPATLAMTTAYLTGKFGQENQIERNLVVVLLAYSVAGFFWGRHLFLRAQDVSWTGGEIGLPAWVRLPQRFDPSVRMSGRHPRLALIVKELQLHQSQFIIAGFLALLHLVLIVVRNTYGHLKETWALEFVAFQFWTLWVVMPLLIGCAAVAEERKLGTLEAQLCLPARRRTQFFAKFGVALGLALLFGVALPVLLEGGRILPDALGFLEKIRLTHTDFPAQGQILAFVADLLSGLGPMLPLLPQSLFAVVFVCLAFYASSLARNTLQAIAPAIMSMLVVWAFGFGAQYIEYLVHYPLWRGWLIYFIGLPVITTAVAGLTYWNFKRVLVGWPVWRRNLTVLLAALAFVTTATTAIYQRAWELLEPLEPAHGAARMAAAEVASMKAEGFGTSIQFADGRSWSSRFYVKNPGLSGALFSNWDLQQMPGSGFVGGSNWVSITQCARDVVALQRDGSLWISEKPEKPRRVWRSGETPAVEEVKLVRYGNDSDWKGLVGQLVVAYALKNDGSLWRIGTNRFDWKKPWPGLRSFDPQQVGTETDWAEISVLNNNLTLRKLDGRVYVYPGYSTSPVESLKLDEDTMLWRAPHLEQNRWRSLAWTSARGWGSVQVGVAEDGTFRVAGDYQQQNGKFKIVERNLQLGMATNWVAVAANYGSAVTLKADGTLWLWEFSENPQVQPESASATRLGRHSDWIAITAEAGGFLSLAADGNLWYWQLPKIYGAQAFESLVRPSRKPQLVGNIFAKAE